MAIRKSSFRLKALYLRGVVVPGGKITHLPEPTFHTFSYNPWRTVLLRFSQICELESSKDAFTIAFFAAVNHNYDHKQRTLKHRNTQNGSKSTNHRSQTMTF